MSIPITEEKTEVGSYFISNYPPFSFWRRDLLGEAEAALDRTPRPGTPLGLYLHVPFCRKRCKFCYFRVYTDKNSHEVERYVAALAREVELYRSREVFASRPLKFAYFGGGTPSFLSEKQLASLVARLRASVSWDGAEEVTFECEPGTLSEKKLTAIRDMGVTRLSLGIENFNDAILEENGRAHRSPEVFRAYEWARAAGFPQINVDLIAGMVGETWDNWRDCVQRTIELAPDSVTIYQMELPWNAVYAGAVGAPGFQVADWKTKRAWVDHAFRELEAAGYGVSSAYTLVKKKAGAGFVYRDAVWHGGDMVGTGVASFSHVAGVHYQNLDVFDDYCSALEEGRLPLARALAPRPEELLIRELILQLKLGHLDFEYFRTKFGVDPRTVFAPAFAEIEHDGYACVDEDGVRLTREGLLRVDALLPHFFLPEHRGARYT
jgi:oxygen-independent coproporphyrinogen-3 oxidase